MKYKCKKCDWVGYQLVSDNSRDDESICPKCGSYYIEVVTEKYNDTNDYYDNISDELNINHNSKLEALQK